MDCMTISTFRSLELQAIRQSKENIRREQLHSTATRLMETFRQEPHTQQAQVFQKPTESVENETANQNRINYFA